MGWASGSELMRGIILAAEKAIPDEKIRKAFYKKVIRSFEDADCDTLYECKGHDPVYDSLVRGRYYDKW